MMKRFINITLLALVGAMVVGCYNDFTMPEPDIVYTDADFSDSEIISIKEFKRRYQHVYGADTDGDSYDVYDDSEEITANIVIRGKVISSDEPGNIYKSLFIQDGSVSDGTRAAIELRLYASNYTKYPIGSTVYVRLKGLSIGDYRGMLSIGAYNIAMMDAYNEAKANGTLSDDNYEDYAGSIHTSIEDRYTLSQHIFLGESGEITEDDVYVVNASNYETLHSGTAVDNYLACLIRFEGLESAFTESGAAAWTTYTYPSYFSSSSSDGSFDWSSKLGEVNEAMINPPLAYSGVNPVTLSGGSNDFYGSSWYTFDRTSESHTAQFILRVSGYARFKTRNIPADGTKVNITAIFTQYMNASGYYITYQLVNSFSEDLVELDDEDSTEDSLE
ncbi:MAG: DUF5689 domain-containing protein [Rikenellaceae bacterium]